MFAAWLYVFMTEKKPAGINQQLRHFGHELTRLRRLSGMSQRTLARATHVSQSLVGSIERAERSPNKDFALKADQELNGAGVLLELWPKLLQEAHPAYADELFAEQPISSLIREYQPLVVPGLLQTDDYARTTIRAGNQTATGSRVHRWVAARIDRQKMLTESDSPAFLAILDECAIRRIVGSPAIMRDQLTRLLSLVAVERIVVQIIPLSLRHHPGLSGAFTILSFRDKPDVVYVEGIGSGSMISEPPAVDDIRLTFGSLQAAAMCPEESVALLEKVREGVDGSQLA